MCVNLCACVCACVHVCGARARAHHTHLTYYYIHTFHTTTVTAAIQTSHTNTYTLPIPIHTHLTYYYIHTSHTNSITVPTTYTLPILTQSQYQATATVPWGGEGRRGAWIQLRLTAMLPIIFCDLKRWEEKKKRSNPYLDYTGSASHDCQNSHFVLREHACGTNSQN
jgi:hypothetical protein